LPNKRKTARIFGAEPGGAHAFTTEILKGGPVRSLQPAPYLTEAARTSCRSSGINCHAARNAARLQNVCAKARDAGNSQAVVHALFINQLFIASSFGMFVQVLLDAFAAPSKIRNAA
jgi:hypothetical protein